MQSYIMFQVKIVDPVMRQYPTMRPLTPNAITEALNAVGYVLSQEVCKLFEIQAAILILVKGQQSLDCGRPRGLESLRRRKVLEHMRYLQQYVAAAVVEQENAIKNALQSISRDLNSNLMSTIIF